MVLVDVMNLQYYKISLSTRKNNTLFLLKIEYLVVFCNLLTFK